MKQYLHGSVATTLIIHYGLVQALVRLGLGLLRTGLCNCTIAHMNSLSKPLGNAFRRCTKVWSRWRSLALFILALQNHLNLSFKFIHFWWCSIIILQCNLPRASTCFNCDRQAWPCFRLVGSGPKSHVYHPVAILWDLKTYDQTLNQFGLALIFRRYDT